MGSPKCCCFKLLLLLEDLVITSSPIRIRPLSSEEFGTLLRAAVVHFGGVLLLTLSTVLEGKMCAVFSRRSLSCWLSGMYSTVLIVGGARDLLVTKDGCGTFQRSSGPYFEHDFSAPV